VFSMICSKLNLGKTENFLKGEQTYCRKWHLRQNAKNRMMSFCHILFFKNVRLVQSVKFRFNRFYKKFLFWLKYFIILINLICFKTISYKITLKNYFQTPKFV
jgi:hypothetical protein